MFYRVIRPMPGNFVTIACGQNSAYFGCPSSCTDPRHTCSVRSYKTEHTLQVVVNMLSSPLTGNPASWIAFSFNPEAVRDARKRGLPVLFGDGSNINVMKAATGANTMHLPSLLLILEMPYMPCPNNECFRIVMLLCA